MYTLILLPQVVENMLIEGELIIMETVKIVNMLQVSKYIKNGVQPLRVEVGKGDNLVFIFSKEETRELYVKWLHRELK